MIIIHLIVLYNLVHCISYGIIINVFELSVLNKFKNIEIYGILLA